MNKNSPVSQASGCRLTGLMKGPAPWIGLFILLLGFSHRGLRIAEETTWLSPWEQDYPALVDVDAENSGSWLFYGISRVYGGLTTVHPIFPQMFGVIFLLSLSFLCSRVSSLLRGGESTTSSSIGTTFFVVAVCASYGRMDLSPEALVAGLILGAAAVLLGQIIKRGLSVAAGGFVVLATLLHPLTGMMFMMTAYAGTRIRRSTDLTPKISSPLGCIALGVIVVLAWIGGIWEQFAPDLTTPLLSAAVPFLALLPLTIGVIRTMNFGANRRLDPVWSIWLLAAFVADLLVQQVLQNQNMRGLSAGFTLLPLLLISGHGLGRLWDSSSTRPLAAAVMVLGLGAVFLERQDAQHHGEPAASPAWNGFSSAVRSFLPPHGHTLVFYAPEPGVLDQARELALSQRAKCGPGRNLRLVMRNRTRDLASGLFDAEKSTLILEWRPALFFALGTEPSGWTLAPWIQAPPIGDGSVLSLVSPADEAELSTDRPQTLDEDTTFVFEVDDEALRGQRHLVFYAYYDRGFGPKGRTLLSSRVLSSHVLSREALSNGRSRYSWRASIRPGDGHEGVRFDDPDLDVAGKPFWWTIGIVAGAEPCNVHSQESHVCSAGSPEITRPHTVAQTRRIWFKHQQGLAFFQTR